MLHIDTLEYTRHTMLQLFLIYSSIQIWNALWTTSKQESVCLIFTSIPLFGSDAQHDYSHLWHYAITASGLTSTNTQHLADFIQLSDKILTWNAQNWPHNLWKRSSHAVFLWRLKILRILCGCGIIHSLYELRFFPLQSEKDDLKKTCCVKSVEVTPLMRVCAVHESMFLLLVPKKTNENEDKYNWSFGVKMSRHWQNEVMFRACCHTVYSLSSIWLNMHLRREFNKNRHC